MSTRNRIVRSFFGGFVSSMMAMTTTLMMSACGSCADTNKEKSEEQPAATTTAPFRAAWDSGHRHQSLRHRRDRDPNHEGGAPAAAADGGE
jgi:hypothetical protein